eukprot:scaffold4189_cov378-Prasinococcus_capsulatus_cf.AAC.12
MAPQRAADVAVGAASQSPKLLQRSAAARPEGAAGLRSQYEQQRCEGLLASHAGEDRSSWAPLLCLAGPLSVTSQPLVLAELETSCKQSVRLPNGEQDAPTSNRSKRVAGVIGRNLPGHCELLCAAPCAVRSSVQAPQQARCTASDLNRLSHSPFSYLTLTRNPAGATTGHTASRHPLPPQRHLPGWVRPRWWTLQPEHEPGDQLCAQATGARDAMDALRHLSLVRHARAGWYVISLPRYKLYLFAHHRMLDRRSPIDDRSRSRSHAGNH